MQHVNDESPHERHVPCHKKFGPGMPYGGREGLHRAADKKQVATWPTKRLLTEMDKAH